LFATNGDDFKLVATYDYKDEYGALLYRKHRKENGAGKKIFFFEPKLGNLRRVLYGLPEMLAEPHRQVFVVEGEKDRDSLTAIGLLAVSPPFGAANDGEKLEKKCPQSFNQHFFGRNVVVIADNDSPGFALGSYESAQLVGVASELRFVERMPGVGEKGDVSDWLAAGGTREQLLEIVERTEKWKPEREERPRAASLDFIRVGDLLAEPDEAVEWIVDGLLSAGGFSAMLAKPKVGKSTLARCIALAVARGEPVLGLATTRGPVLYLALEESRRQVKAHFRALGATDEDDVHVYAARMPAEGLIELRAAVAKYQPVLVEIDTLFRATRVKDTSAYAEVTVALDPSSPSPAS
jgi:putative DNA primase/helicase